MQFETARTAMAASLLTVGEVHLHYVNSGGSFDELEVDAYLHGLASLPDDERDCVAQAVNELIDDLAIPRAGDRLPRASYSGSHSMCGVAAPHTAVRRRLVG